MPNISKRKFESIEPKYPKILPELLNSESNFKKVLSTEDELIKESRKTSPSKKKH